MDKTQQKNDLQKSSNFFVELQRVNTYDEIMQIYHCKKSLKCSQKMKISLFTKMLELCKTTKQAADFCHHCPLHMDWLKKIAVRKGIDLALVEIEQIKTYKDALIFFNFITESRFPYYREYYDESTKMKKLALECLINSCKTLVNIKEVCDIFSVDLSYYYGTNCYLGLVPLVLKRFLQICKTPEELGGLYDVIVSSLHLCREQRYSIIEKWTELCFKPEQIKQLIRRLTGHNTIKTTYNIAICKKWFECCTTTEQFKELYIFLLTVSLKKM